MDYRITEYQYKILRLLDKEARQFQVLLMAEETVNTCLVDFMDMIKRGLIVNQYGDDYDLNLRQSYTDLDVEEYLAENMSNFNFNVIIKRITNQLQRYAILISSKGKICIEEYDREKEHKDHLEKTQDHFTRLRALSGLQIAVTIFLSLLTSAAATVLINGII